jgi:hypothetical protein
LDIFACQNFEMAKMLLRYQQGLLGEVADVISSMRLAFLVPSKHLQQGVIGIEFPSCTANNY